MVYPWMFLCEPPSKKGATEVANAMPFVLDKPVVSGWFLQSQATPYTKAIAQRLRTDVAYLELALRLQCPIQAGQRRGRTRRRSSIR